MPDERLARTLAALQRTIAEPGADVAIRADAAAWLRDAGLDPEDADAVARFPPARLLVYRRLARKATRGIVRMQLERTAARGGAAFDAALAAFVDAELPRSHYLRDVPAQFLAFALPRWAGDASAPPWLGDLARHELSAYEVSAAPGDASEGGGPIALDRAVRFHPSARVLCFDWAVHELAEDLDPRRSHADAPPRRPTALFVYRDALDEVRWLSQSPLAAAILERLLERATLGDAVRGACEALGHAVDGAVLEGTATLLADLADRGALLGGDPP